MDSFLSIQEAADNLRVDYKTVYRLVRAGKLPAGKFGGMYRIRREDLEAYFQAQVAATAGRSQEAALPPTETPLKCGACFRILRSPREVAGTCATAGCGEPVCAICWGGGARHCAGHQPDGQARLAQAQAALARGEIGHLVTAVAARQLEQAWLARFDERIRDIGSLYHPGTAEILRIADWAPFRSADDETLQLMQMLNVGYLDRASQATLPHNELARYLIPSGGLGWGKPRQGLLLEARCAGHLAEFVDQGFDTRPTDLEELLLLLADLEKLAAEAEATVIAGLASPTGWDEPALAHITDERGRAYRHPSVLPCLVDLETGAVISNGVDERLSKFGYAELFKLPLAREEAAALAPEIEAMLAGREGLPVVQLAQLLGMPEPLVLRACRVLANAGRYKLVEEGELAPLIVRNRL